MAFHCKRCGRRIKKRYYYKSGLCSSCYFSEVSPKLLIKTRHFGLSFFKTVILLLVLVSVYYLLLRNNVSFNNTVGADTNKDINGLVKNNNPLDTTASDNPVSDLVEKAVNTVVEKINEKPSVERKEECQKVFAYLNELRKNEGLSEMVWDERAYTMAVERSKDMIERNYTGHLTPEGECMLTLKAKYGFGSNEIVAENTGGMTYYADMMPIPSTDVFEVLNSWINSSGHRANLFYPEHAKGAIGCYKCVCVFNGVHNNSYGLGAAPCSMYSFIPYPH